jgi:hypothetical protein
MTLPLLSKHGHNHNVQVVDFSVVVNVDLDGAACRKIFGSSDVVELIAHWIFLMAMRRWL